MGHNDAHDEGNDNGYDDDEKDRLINSFGVKLGKNYILSISS